MTDTSNQGFVAIAFPRGGREGIERHFADHQEEFKGITIEEYEMKAIALLNSIPDDNIEGFTDIEDRIYRYNKENNEFAKCRPDGVIITFFKPERNQKKGLRYWRNQVRLFSY
jgi:pyocin large subunit-like protein